MPFRKTALILWPVLLLSAGILAYWGYHARGRLYSDPAARRHSEAYEQALAPATNLPAFSSNLFGKILLLASNASSLELSLPQSAAKSGEYQRGIVQRVNGSVASVGAGTISLQYIGSAYGVPRAPLSYSSEIPGRFYTPAFRELTSEEITKTIPAWRRKLGFHGEFPAALFGFQTTNIGQLRPLGFKAFDARTKRNLTGGYDETAQPGGFTYGSEVRLWHQTPIELLVTIATGPIETFEMRPAAGAELAYPGGVLKLVAVLDGKINSWGSQNNGSSNVVRLGIQRSTPDEGPASSFALFSWPDSSSLPLELEFLGRDGKPLRQNGGGSSDELIIASIQARREEIERIRVKFYPKIYRLLFAISELPGLPEENRNIQNLFDIRVPYARFRYEGNLESAVAQLVQMDQPPYLPLNRTNIVFPLTRTNTTARELFHELSRNLADPHDRLEPDSVNNKIDVRPEPLYALWQKLKRLIH